MKKKKVKTPYRIPVAKPSRSHGDAKKYNRKAERKLNRVTDQSED